MCPTTRRRILGFTRVSLMAGLLALVPLRTALAALSEGEASSGIQAALERGASAAVDMLGVNDGFLGNPKVRIALPERLRKVHSAARLLGMDAQFEALEVGINRAAEAAVPQAKTLLIEAARKLSMKDAIAIVRGGDDAVTRYFRSSAEAQITARFTPIVASSINKLDLARQYDQLAAQGARLGLVKEDQASLERYVTARAVDGLFQIIAEKERELRADPIGTGSAILKKVFGAF